MSNTLAVHEMIFTTLQEREDIIFDMIVGEFIPFYEIFYLDIMFLY
jgi:hypothetical protein